MKNGYKRKFKYNLFGRQCGLNIIKRLDWINGKPMVWTAVINLILLAVNKVVANGGVDVAELNALTSSLGWVVFCFVAKLAFWVLFVDGLIVNFLFGYTRGSYCRSVFKKALDYSSFSEAYESAKEDIAWAYFLHTHPEFDYKLQELGNRYVAKAMETGSFDYEGSRREQEALFKTYGVLKDEKGRYYTLKDKKYRKLLEKL